LPKGLFAAVAKSNNYWGPSRKMTARTPIYAHLATRFQGFVIRLHVLEDLDDTCRRVPELLPNTRRGLRPDDRGAGSAKEAIGLASRELGADPGHWVNQGILQDEYNGFVK
jgi:hypothetical protein